MMLDEHRTQVLASIGTRLAVGAYPLAFLLLFGWAYGKQAFDTASAASNWANYLSLLLLSGFILVPPAVARLRAVDRHPQDAAIVRDHVALERILLLVGVVAAVLLWATIELAFPVLAQQSGKLLNAWNALFAILALAQIPATLWLGVAQAAAKFRPAFILLALPRVAALVVLVVGAGAGASPTSMLVASILIIIGGQWALARTARLALHEIDAEILRERGRAVNVLAKNVSAGTVSLVGSMVTMVPVTLVGRLVPDEVGYAHAIVALSNAVGAVIVAAFFPVSLTLGARIKENADVWRYCLHIARGVALITASLVAVAWLAYPMCNKISAACSASIFAVGSLVVCGAGLRLASLGVYHVAAFKGHPLYALPSVAAEAIAVVGFVWLLLSSWMLYALGIAFVIGGSFRLLIALGYERKLLADRAT
jgi:hypothetical protein